MPVDSLSAAGIVYAIWFGILGCCTVYFLFDKDRRSYILAYTILVCLCGIGLGGAYSVDSMYTNPNTEVWWEFPDVVVTGFVPRWFVAVNAQAAFYTLLLGAVMVTLVAVAAESARSAARTAGKTGISRIILAISVLGHILAIIYVSLLTMMEPVPVRVRVVFHALCIFLAMVLWAWGFFLGGMSRGNKILAPILVTCAWVGWSYELTGRILEAGHFSLLTLWTPFFTWGIMFYGIFAALMVFAWRPTREAGLLTTYTSSAASALMPPMATAPTPPVQEATFVTCPTVPDPPRRPYRLGATKTIAPPSVPQSNRKAAAAKAQQLPLPEQPEQPEQPQQPTSFAMWSPLASSSSYTQVSPPPPYGGPMTPMHIEPHQPYTVQPQYEAQEPASIDPSSLVWIQMPGEPGRWTTYGELNKPQPSGKKTSS